MNQSKKWEILAAVLALALFLAGATAAIDPSGQLARIRNTQRRADLNTLGNRISEKLIYEKGDWDCASGPIPTTATAIGNLTTGQYDMSECLVPSYFPKMPVDPKEGFIEYKRDNPNYYSDYTIIRHSNGRVTISAPSAEIGEIISVSK